MFNLKVKFALFLLIIFSVVEVKAQSSNPPSTIVGGNPNSNPIITAVPFLTIAPEARGAAMGDMGVATSADVNSAHWNPSKYAVIDDEYGVSLSYNPWLQKIVGDMSLSYLAGYKRLNDRQTIGLSMKYFDLGSINFTDDQGNITRNFNPREYSFDGHFAMQLSKRYSMAVSARYIYSNLAGSISSNGTQDSKPAHGFAADISGYWQNPDIHLGQYTGVFAWGWNISNIGTKMNYNSTSQEDFLPTNLRLGTTLTMDLDPYNKITFGVDVNKLLVPTPDPNDSTNSYKSVGVLEGMWYGLTKAPGGFSEKMKEFMWSVGAEYWYNDLFAARMGYFYENPDKGDRQYMQLGLGVKYQVVTLDFSYLLSFKRNNPLEDTLRFTLSFNFGDKTKKGSKKSSGGSSGGNDVLDADDI
ncbi:type IX secretion system outer membrane channel protein PorV [Flammeovirga agarivorans]|uniref:Type IX secretion system outer membrane channel protein PorV n=1 Tax=Flammeovirga agarivorans TaxID=2726742 RepID=A0A7X8SGD1_9BACT|nr:type IX secretion system outer membrane channel protein PorV [Flammeovirga agarivorans]NLR89684.1 type IX secretion system outer membrane channel protein PorV [Flammeovirga agarivorans]